jgi:hypothetical protein
MTQRVVVIGSGLAGSLICDELSAAASVTLLEIGDAGSISYPRVEYVRRALAEVKTFCYGGGGTTNLWHNGLIPMNPDDIGSPIFRDLLTAARPFMDAAAAKLFFPGPAYAEAYGNAVAETARIGDTMGVFEHGLDCLLYPKKFTRLKVGPGVQAFYRVSSIDFTVRGSRIESLTFTDDAGQHRIPADAVVISAGTLGTPRLVEKVLAATGHSDSSVGTGLIDHPLGFVGKARLRKQHCAPMRQLSLLDKGDYECCTGARLKSRCGRYTCIAFFRPALTMANDLAIYKYKSLLGASGAAERLRHIFSPKILHPDIVAEILTHLFKVDIRSRVFNILVYFEQKRGVNAVTSGEQGLRVDWRVSDEELAVYNDLLGALRDMLLPLAEEINIQIPVTQEWLWSGAHHSGTISLGNEGTELLDTDLRLRCCDNAFVCDGSVIQEHSYANTGLTIGQLALRLAGRIAAAPA